MQRTHFTVGAYRTVQAEPIGRGAFAEVFRAETTDGSQRTAAIKVIDCARLESHRDQARLLRAEVDITRRLKHPNIVELLDVVLRKPYLYLILELADGGDLAQYVRKQPQRRLSETRARCVVRQLAAGLGFLHAHHIVHRDLKPQNLLLVRDTVLGGYVIKIADFGFARLLGTSEQSMAATMCGSPLYMAPEVLRGDAYDDRADLWSVGVILFELLNGTAPFRAASIAALQRAHDAHARGNVPAVLPWSKSVEARTSAACLDLVGSLLQCDPRKRLAWEPFLSHAWISSSTGKPSAPTPDDDAARLYTLAMRHGVDGATWELDGDTAAAQNAYRQGLDALHALQKLVRTEHDGALVDDLCQQFQNRWTMVTLVEPKTNSDSCSRGDA